MGNSSKAPIHSPPAMADPARPPATPAAGESPLEPGALSQAEIEAILEREATALPPESGVDVPPVRFVTREPGGNRLSRWATWVWVIVFLGFLVMHAIRQ